MTHESSWRRRPTFAHKYPTFVTPDVGHVPMFDAALERFGATWNYSISLMECLNKERHDNNSCRVPREHQQHPTLYFNAACFYLFTLCFSTCAENYIILLLQFQFQLLLICARARSRTYLISFLWLQPCCVAHLLSVTFRVRFNSNQMQMTNKHNTHTAQRFHL